jgi:hypothetical protein
MATPKELEITQALIAAAIDVNSSNDDVNVNVDVQRSGVQVRISPDKEVTNPTWDWLFYPENTAYFSGDTFDEETFVKRCDVFMSEINKHMISRDADGVQV